MSDLEQLIAQLDHDDNKVRIAAIKALSHFEASSEAISALTELLNDSSTAIVRSTVLALGQLGDCTTLDYLLPLLNTEDLWVQKAVIQAIGQLGCQDVVPVLVNLLGTNDFGALAREALVALKVDPDFF